MEVFLFKKDCLFRWETKHYHINHQAHQPIDPWKAWNQNKDFTLTLQKSEGFRAETSRVKS
jgi:hypothetical protein